jgi:rare lipoprotein A (peptidoglycan hydrolase)
MSRRAAAAWILLIVLLCSVVPAQAADYGGNATWYGTGPGAGHAAAGPRLRVGHWRGSHVRVCHAGKCVNVVLDDWCKCASGDRVIDLSDEDFSQLANLSEGVIRVTVTTTNAPRPKPPQRAPAPTGPPTDIEVPT